MPQPFRIAISAALLLGAAMPAFAQSPVEVATFGAVPNDNSDDTQALKDALATLTGNQKLVFEPGQYDLFLQDPPGQFLLNGLTNIELAGCHATLMLHGFSPEDPAPWKINQLFGFSNCQGVTVSNLTIEMSRAPFSCGTVEVVTGNQGRAPS